MVATVRSRALRACVVLAAVTALSQAPRPAHAEGNNLGYGRGGSFRDYNVTV